MSEHIPLFPLDLVLFPGGALPLHIFEERYKEMIEECMAGNLPFGVVQAHKDGISAVGCSAEVVSMVNRYDDGRLDILTEGRTRFRILTPDRSRAFLQGEIEYFEDVPTGASDAGRERALASHFELLHLYGSELDNFSQIAPDARVSFVLAATLPVDLNFKQAILELRSEPERLRLLNEYYDAVLPEMRHIGSAKRIARGNGHIM